jgi:DNA segregation ATPase FtsK/SpoIIIE, S-DNA-T family
MDIRFTVVSARPESPGGNTEPADVTASVHSEATLLDVVTSLQAAGLLSHIPDEITVNGATVNMQSRALNVIRDGSIIGPRSVRGIEYEGGYRSPARGVLLNITGGPDSGRSFQIADGDEVTVGRDVHATISLDDPSVSRHHLIISATTGPRSAGGPVIRLEARDAQSANGSFLNGQPLRESIELFADDAIEFGASELIVTHSVDDDRPLLIHGSLPHVVFNRPPRRIEGRLETVLTPPDKQPAPPTKLRFRLAGAILPVLFAGLMVWVTKQPTFALFALMSPVMMIATWIGDRRHNKQQHRSTVGEHREALIAFAEQVDQARSREIAFRHAQLIPTAEIVRRATGPSRLLWERRCLDDDFLQLRVGVGSPLWEPMLKQGSKLHDDAAQMLASRQRLNRAPIGVSATAGNIIGIVGTRAFTLAIARSLVIQAVTLHGPSDVQFGLLADDSTANEWDWIKWMPHTSEQCVAATSTQLVELVKNLVGKLATDSGTKTSSTGLSGFSLGGKRPSSTSTGGPSADSQIPTTLLMCDSGEQLPAALRRLIHAVENGLVAIVVSETIDQLPAECSVVISVDETDPFRQLAQIDFPRLGYTERTVALNGISRQTASTTARSMARFIDPDTNTPGASLPTRSSLMDLLGLYEPDAPIGAKTLAARWKTRVHTDAIAGPIGVSEDGVITLDLLRDGPHGLVGGTTGSGKSELLRTIVLGLALSARPDELTFVLIDYKGGSAFDVCADLPHVVGLLTDLDAAQSARAMRSLEAELRYREEFLRQVGAQDLLAYGHLGRPLGPLPRLMIVVDEFAALKSELPDFVDALIDVAQRGRSLGVHLLLATQRPSGVVSDLIRANTEFKICLRVQENSESVDVIGTPLASSLHRNTPGRAVIRIGKDSPVVLQSSYCGAAVTERTSELVQLSTFELNAKPRALDKRSFDDVNSQLQTSHTEMQLLVEMAQLAATALEIAAPRQPWTNSLGLGLQSAGITDALESSGWAPSEPNDLTLTAGIIDDPDHQKLLPLSWDALDGNLCLVGSSSRDVGAAIATVTQRLCATLPSDRLHVYLLLSLTEWASSFTDLPQVGATVSLSDRDRVARLIRYLSNERARRSQLNPVELACEPTVVVCIDRLASVRAELEETSSSSFESLLRLLAEGPAVGIRFVAGLDRPAMLSSALGSAFQTRWVFNLADPLDLSLFGLRPAQVGNLDAMRLVLPGSGLHAQVGLPVEHGRDVVVPVRFDELAPAVPGISVLPGSVSVGELTKSRRAAFSSRPWQVPIGIADESLQAAFLSAHAGEHLLVCSPARSGRTSTLLSIGAQSRMCGATVVVLAPERSVLHEHFVGSRRFFPNQISELCTEIGQLDEAQTPTVLLVDDAELIDDVATQLERLITGATESLFVAAAVRADYLRTNYSHWTRSIRRSRLAVLLQPTDTEAEFVGYPIPRRSPLPKGRGYLCDSGTLQLVQFAGGELVTAFEAS